jgi:hypothetical protein
MTRNRGGDQQIILFLIPDLYPHILWKREMEGLHRFCGRRTCRVKEKYYQR